MSSRKVLVCFFFILILYWGVLFGLFSCYGLWYFCNLRRQMKNTCRVRYGRTQYAAIKIKSKTKTSAIWFQLRTNLLSNCSCKIHFCIRFVNIKITATQQKSFYFSFTFWFEFFFVVCFFLEPCVRLKIKRNTSHINMERLMEAYWKI